MSIAHNPGRPNGGPSGYRFAPRIFRSGRGALFSSRFIAIATLLGTPLVGSWAIAMNYFRLGGLDNQVNGALAAVTGMISFFLMYSMASASPYPILTFIVLMAVASWLAHATAHDCFAAYYVSDDQDSWIGNRDE